MAEKFPNYVKDIQNRVRGQRVLDIGCLATTRSNILKRHNEYRKHAKEMIGIDHNKKWLGIMKNKGAKNLYYLDITDTPQVEIFKTQFGVFDHIIATDVIEHIGNLSLFLDNINLLLSDKGWLYLTTPNAMSPSWIYWCMTEGGETRVNSDHVCFFDVKTLRSLLSRSNLEIKKLMYQGGKSSYAEKIGLEPKKWMGKRIYAVVMKK